jgi:Na+/H+ antiporter NhaC
MGALGYIFHALILIELSIYLRLYLRQITNIYNLQTLNFKMNGIRIFTTLFIVLCLSFAFVAPIGAQDTIKTNPDTLKTDSIGIDTTAKVDTLAVVPSEIVDKIDTLLLTDWAVASIDTTKIFFTASAESGANEFYAAFKINGAATVLHFVNGKAEFAHEAGQAGKLFQLQSELKVAGKTEKVKQTKLVRIQQQGTSAVRTTEIPLWMSLLPPLLAIFLALVFKEVLLALFVGIFAGVWIISGMPLAPYELLRSFVRVLDTYILHAITESSHAAVILFSIMIGGVVALISRNGGMAGIVAKLAPLARGAKSTQIVTVLLGVAIFFDDYANSLIVGNTMRPLTDKYKISREKLSYLVDSTSAPVAAIAFITTWIGAELGYIGDALPSLEGMTVQQSAYSIFLQSLAYSFYSIFTIVFVLMVIIMGRDFGAMYKAEERARTTGAVFHQDGADNHIDMQELEPVAGAPLRWINGFLPVAIIVFGTLWGLVDTGISNCYNQLAAKGISLAENSWSSVWAAIPQLEAKPEEVGGLRKMGMLIGSSDSYSALLWASILAIVSAIVLTVVQRIQKLAATMETMVMGFKTMLPALLILIFAWSLASTTKELCTAEFLTTLLDGSISPYMMPVLIFLLASVIAFSTGSSWSTMAILYPIAIPMTWTICQNAGIPEAEALPILYNVIATVLAASVFGDHCSPISDTTILSSLASNCNHLAHVRTQMPYAVLVGVVSIIIGYIATAVGTPFLVNMGLAIGIFYLFLRFVGKKTSM